MADYSIYILAESELTITNGDVLDGVNQGSGVHLTDTLPGNPTFITLNSNRWIEIEINDNDANFQDNDSGQTTDADYTIDNVLYPSGTQVEAEYAITLSDGTTTYTALAFNFATTNPSYGTVEGLAFIGDPGGFPPIGTPLEVVGVAEGPSFAVADYATPICYAHGTMIDTPHGPTPIQSLAIGDLVLTADHGAQPLLWTGCRSVLSVGLCAAIRIPGHLLRGRSDLLVSRQHRILVEGSAVELACGTVSGFMPAIRLVEAGLAEIVHGREVAYYHIGLARHEVIWANGIASESYFAGDTALASSFFLTPPPCGVGQGQLARRSLTRHEAQVVLSRFFKPASVGAVRRIAA